MAYNYLGLVNDVNRRFNEVELTSANFATATGYYADVKNAVNSALRRINHEEFEWPFNHVKQTLTLVPNQLEYSYEADAKSVAFDTFRIAGDTTFNNMTMKLSLLDYEEFLKRNADMEFNPADHADVPRQVYRARALKFGIVPPPDLAYELTYEYYRLPVDLVDWDDVPTVPVQFRWVIEEGAKAEAYMFRGAIEESAMAEDRFKKGLASMRKIYLNRYDYMRSTVIQS